MPIAQVHPLTTTSAVGTRDFFLVMILIRHEAIQLMNSLGSRPNRFEHQNLFPAKPVSNQHATSFVR